jgi:hypothetical protein
MSIFKDRAKETTTETGTVGLLLLGAVTGYQSLPHSSAQDFYYCIAHTSADEWEVGIGNASSGSLERLTILDGSDGPNNAVNFSEGTKDVFCTCPAVMLGAAKPVGTATQTTEDDTPMAITVPLTPSPPTSGGIKFIHVRYSVFAYKNAGGGSRKAWDGTLVYADGAGSTDLPTVLYDPDTNGWAIAASVDGDAFVVTVTGDASSNTYWKVTATVELSIENGA